MRAVLPVMRRQRSGHIINISSVAGVVGQMHCSAYGATKFAVEGLSLATAQEVGQFGIRVTVVEPGFFLTDLLAISNVRYAESTIADYAPEGTAEAMWSPYDGKQTGSPDKLGDWLVDLTRMANPPQVFVGGSTVLPRSPLRSRLGSRTCATTTRCRDRWTSMLNPSSLPTFDRSGAPQPPSPKPEFYAHEPP